MLPKENSDWNDCQEYEREGLHRAYIHINNTLRKVPRIDCHTKAHTPKPLYAIYSPTIPDMLDAITDAYACDLKSTATVPEYEGLVRYQILESEEEEGYILYLYEEY